MSGMDMSTMSQAESLVGMWVWPATRRFHGVSVEVIDAHGALLPRRLLHHTYMVNFDRRQLVYPILERPFSFGEETQNLTPPATIGLPMINGQHLGIIIMWNNETGRDVDGAFVRYTFQLNPRHQSPPPVDVMPFFVDVHLVIGGADTFSVAPGGRSLSSDFTLPISGHLLAAGGHLHDHAIEVRLDDPRTGRTLVRVRAIRDSLGHVRALTREHPDLWRGGLHLLAGHPYRLVVVYDNPTADTLHAVMGMMGGIFVPDRRHSWPALDETNPDTRADRAALLRSIPQRRATIARHVN